MRLFFLIAALLQAPAPRGSVAGTVIVSGTTTPIADAEIAIVTSDGVLETTTDASGRFAMDNVPAGRQTVLIRADGFFVESTTPNTISAPNSEPPPEPLEPLPPNDPPPPPPPPPPPKPELPPPAAPPRHPY